MGREKGRGTWSHASCVCSIKWSNKTLISGKVHVMCHYPRSIRKGNSVAMTSILKKWSTNRVFCEGLGLHCSDSSIPNNMTNTPTLPVFENNAIMPILQRRIQPNIKWVMVSKMVVAVITAAAATVVEFCRRNTRLMQQQQRWDQQHCNRKLWVIVDHS